jgi:predicted Zn-dependent protease
MGIYRHSRERSNAFALPGGKVAFWEGMMPIAQDHNGIAVVMGHEIAHALARHGAERMSQTMGAQAIGELLAAGVGRVKPGMRDDFLKVYGLGTTVGVLLPWGRTQESEADRIGLTLMAKAGYDPASAIGFWERMSKIAGESRPNFCPPIRATPRATTSSKNGCPKRVRTTEESKRFQKFLLQLRSAVSAFRRLQWDR